MYDVIQDQEKIMLSIPFVRFGQQNAATEILVEDIKEDITEDITEESLS